MAEIVIAAGSSHGPSIQSTPEHWARLGEGDTRDPRFDFEALKREARPGLEKELTLDVWRTRHAAARNALKTLNRELRAARLDVVVVISNVHRVYPADHHPVFGVFRAENFPVTTRADRPFNPDDRFINEDMRPKDKNVVTAQGHAPLANHLIETLIADDFDVACLDQLPDGKALDDAFTFTYDWMLGDRAVPMVPFFLSRDLPNQPHPKRCHALGAALGRAIRSFPGNLRVGLIASGGLSHQFLDEDLDRQVIVALTGGRAGDLTSLDRARLNRGPGTPEILNWIAVASAMAPAALELIDYVPAYRSLASTGHGLTFGIWR